MEVKKEVKEKERGVLLTAWLILAFISNIYYFVNLVSDLERIREFFEEMEFYLFFTSYTLITLLAIISVIFLFLWKKWAFFSLALSYFLGAMLTVIMTPMGGYHSFVLIIFPIGILYILMKEKWEFFE